MSILIKDENMPESCGQCWLLVSGTDANGKPKYECLLTDEKRALEELFSKRGKYCPIVEIPPHGRLIDANVFEEMLNSEGGVELKDVPTVIESEKEQEYE